MIFHTHIGRLSLIVITIILLALISSCTALTETECRFADFAALGYSDANKGRMRSHFERYHEKCLSYDIDIEDELVMYDYGRERGLLSYCESVRFSRQCDRGNSAGLKSSLLIPTEMIRLRQEVPPVQVR
jgi:hypothetical protein